MICGALNDTCWQPCEGSLFYLSVQRSHGSIFRSAWKLSNYEANNTLAKFT
jgi:hypothetical protein